MHRLVCEVVAIHSLAQGHLDQLKVFHLRPGPNPDPDQYSTEGHTNQDCSCSATLKANPQFSYSNVCACVCTCSHGFLTLLLGRNALPRFFLACWMWFCRASLRGSLSALHSKIRLKDLLKKPLCRAQRCWAIQVHRSLCWLR